MTSHKSPVIDMSLTSSILEHTALLLQSLTLCSHVSEIFTLTQIKIIEVLVLHQRKSLNLEIQSYLKTSAVATCNTDCGGGIYNSPTAATFCQG